MRKPLYFSNILKGRLSPGYAIDDLAGIVFENEKYIRTVAADDKSNAYYVSAIDGKIDEKILPVTEILKWEVSNWRLEIRLFRSNRFNAITPMN